MFATIIHCIMNRGAAGPATLLLLVVLSTPAPAQAIEVNAFEVARNGETYRLHSDVKLGAEPEKVRRVLHRFESIPSLDPDISDVTIVGSNADGSVRMELAASQCFIMVCIPYTWTQDVRLLPSGEIYALMVPGGGDIESGWVRYRIEGSGDWTRLIVDAEIDASGIALPAALIEPLMHARLRDEALETARLVERAAR